MKMNMKMNCLLLLILSIMYTVVSSETSPASAPASESTTTTTTTGVRFSRPSSSDNFLGNLFGGMAMFLFLIGIVICTRPKHKYDDNYIVATNSDTLKSTTILEEVIIDDNLLD